MTPAERSALRWLKERNGTGVFAEKSNHSVLIAAGERGPFRRGTWSKLCGSGMVTIDRLRVTVTSEGLKANVSDAAIPTSLDDFEEVGM